MSKRFLSFIGLIALVALAATIVSACAGSATPAPTAAPAAPAPTTAAAAKPAAPAAAPTTAAAPAAQFPKMDIKLGHGGVLDMSYSKGADKFSELVKERTGGNVNVQVFPNSALGSEKDMLEQVKNGVIQISLTTPVMLATYDGWGPIGVTAMPYVFPGNTDEEQYPAVMKLLRGPVFKEINDSAAKISGVRALDLGWWYGTRNLTTKSKQVLHPDDAKGLKIRTMDTPLAKAALGAIGVTVTPMAVAELYNAMQMGVVEGQENPINTIYASKYYEVQKYLSLTGHMTMTVLMVTNDKWFQGLPPALQDVLQKSMYDAGDYQSDIQLKMNKQNLQDLKDKGMVVAEVNKAEFADKTKDAWKEFQPIFGAGMYEKITAAAKN